MNNKEYEILMDRFGKTKTGHRLNVKGYYTDDDLQGYFKAYFDNQTELENFFIDYAKKQGFEIVYHLTEKEYEAYLKIQNIDKKRLVLESNKIYIDIENGIDVELNEKKLKVLSVALR